MEEHEITSKILSDLLIRHPEGNKEVCSQFIIIYGWTGTGKTDIVKQYLSRNKGNKLYLSDYSNYNYKKLNDYDDFIIVFDEILHPFLDELLIATDYSKKKDCEIILITRKKENYDSYVEKINNYISKHEKCELIVLKMCMNLIDAVEYIASNGVSDSGVPYRGNEPLTNME